MVNKTLEDFWINQSIWMVNMTMLLETLMMALDLKKHLFIYDTICKAWTIAMKVD